METTGWKRSHCETLGSPWPPHNGLPELGMEKHTEEVEREWAWRSTRIRSLPNLWEPLSLHMLIGGNKVLTSSCPLPQDEMPVCPGFISDA